VGGRPKGWSKKHTAFEEALGVPLFERSTLWSLSTTLFIMNCCHTHGTSNTFISKLLGLLKKNILPNPNTLPSLEHEVFRTMKRFGLVYNTIDVCVKGYILFQGDYANAIECIKCGESRYRQIEKSTMARKMLQHFPLIPCLQRMCNVPMQAELMV
jgi:hypothetical protein